MIFVLISLAIVSITIIAIVFVIFKFRKQKQRKETPNDLNKNRYEEELHVYQSINYEYLDIAENYDDIGPQNEQIAIYTEILPPETND